MTEQGTFRVEVMKGYLSRHTNLVTFIVLVIALALLTDGASLSIDSLRNLAVAESVRAFAALGVGMIIITRGIDLSVGAVVCLVASVTASFAQNPDYRAAIYPGVEFPLWLPIVAGIAVGAAFGLFNGLLVACAKLPPFIATLGSMSVAFGCQLIYTRANVVGSLKESSRELTELMERMASTASTARTGRVFCPAKAFLLKLSEQMAASMSTLQRTTCMPSLPECGL